jgi:DNA helicase TIP49 (TBP-interacting protein)
LAHAIANETGVPFYKISATEVVSGVSGTEFYKGSFLMWVLKEICCFGV